MKYLLFAALLCSGISATAQDDKAEIEKAVRNYLEGFYEGDTAKLQLALRPDLNKYGYYKGKDEKYAGSRMTYREAINFARNVREKKNFPKADAPKEVVVLDQQPFIAVAKIVAWWGADYLLLSKKDGGWKVEQVIWQGPLATVTR